MEVTKKTIIDNLKDKTSDKGKINAFESLGGTSINYKSFYEIVDVYAKAFKELGVQRGEVVTICTAGTLDTILYFAGLNRIGAIAQFVNPNFLKYNSHRYINETNCKLLICLDRFYPDIKDAIETSNVEKILLSSISEYSSYLYKVIAKRKKVSNTDKIKNVEYIYLPNFIKMGELSQIKLTEIPYEKDRPAVISYTSGTTGNPKGVVHTNDAINNMIKMYELANGIGAKAGYRNLVLIPPMYLTSLIHEIITPMSLGATNIMQPIYKPKNFYKDLRKYEPQATVGSKAHYMSLDKNKGEKNSLYFLRLAYCGGEPYSKASIYHVNDTLDYFGADRLIIGYGETEFGTMVMFNNDIPFRTNESGILLPEVKARIVDIVSGKEIKEGRGELQIQTPAMMKEYLNNKEGTMNFFETDEDGKVWAKTGDIAEVVYRYNENDVYEVYGRKTDSFIDENGLPVYLFEIENKIEEIEYVKEAEVVALTIDGKTVPVVHIILNKKAQKAANKVLNLVDKTLKVYFKNPSYIPYAYKLRKEFSTSVISGKRDYESLKYETEDYLILNENGEFVKAELISDESLNQNEFVHSKILLKKVI